MPFFFLCGQIQRSAYHKKQREVLQDQAGKEETKKGQVPKGEGANEAALRKGFPGAFFAVKEENV